MSSENHSIGLGGGRLGGYTTVLIDSLAHTKHIFCLTLQLFNSSCSCRRPLRRHRGHWQPRWDHRRGQRRGWCWLSRPWTPGWRSGRVLLGLQSSLGHSTHCHLWKWTSVELVVQAARLRLHHVPTPLVEVPGLGTRGQRIPTVQASTQPHLGYHKVCCYLISIT